MHEFLVAQFNELFCLLDGVQTDSAHVDGVLATSRIFQGFVAVAAHVLALFYLANLDLLKQERKLLFWVLVLWFHAYDGHGLEIQLIVQIASTINANFDNGGPLRIYEGRFAGIELQISFDLIYYAGAFICFLKLKQLVDEF